MEPEDIAKCQFVPISSIKRAMDYIDAPSEKKSDNCKRNLLKLQKQTIFGKVNYTAFVLNNKYHIALYKAINSHDWNKLLYLLKRNPISHHTTIRLQGRTHYIRALAILMMFHPDAQSQNMLQEYLHMVCSCRTIEEKRALMKLILSLPQKIVEKFPLYPIQYRYLKD